MDWNTFEMDWNTFLTIFWTMMGIAFLVMVGWIAYLPFKYRSQKGKTVKNEDLEANDKSVNG